jgi:hypothetical protein
MNTVSKLADRPEKKKNPEQQRNIGKGKKKKKRKEMNPVKRSNII